eukprot:400625_1
MSKSLYGVGHRPRRKRGGGQQRTTRKALATETLDILSAGGYHQPGGSGEWIEISEMQQNAEKNTKLYIPSDDLIAEAKLEECEQFDLSESQISASFEHPQIEVWQCTTLEACTSLVAEGLDVVALNFASGKNPGGGFLGGAQAQEESIARSSGLYPCIKQKTKYYEANKRTKDGFYTEHLIHSPCVPVFRSDNGSLLPAPFCVSIITAPAVNAGHVGLLARKADRSVPENSIDDAMFRRIMRILACALIHNHRAVVLGAYGCGVFRNDPARVARIFARALRCCTTGQSLMFGRVVFAICGGWKSNNLLEFENVFGDKTR